MENGRHPSRRGGRERRVAGAVASGVRPSGTTAARPVAAASGDRRDVFDPARGRRCALPDHERRAGGGDRRAHRRDALGTRPAHLRRRRASDQQRPSRGGLLGRRRRRPHRLGNRRRLPDRRRCQDRSTGSGVRRQRAGRPHRRSAALAPRAALPVAGGLAVGGAAHRRRHDRRRNQPHGLHHLQGGAARLHLRPRRAHRKAAVGVSHRAAERRRVRRRHLGRRIVALHRQRQRLGQSERGPGARLRLHSDLGGGAGSLRRPSPG